MHRFREPFNGLSHLAGALLSAAGLAVLIILTRDDPPKMITMIVYGVSLILLYSASTVLHLVRASERTLARLNHLDHAMIYILIAGTYTPFCYNLLEDPLRRGMLIAIWGLAAIGVVEKLAFFRGSGTLLYIAMGWLGVIALPQMVRALPLAALGLLAGGGVLYTSGALFYVLDDPEERRRWFGYHELWHLFVLVGSASHYAAIAFYIA